MRSLYTIAAAFGLGASLAQGAPTVAELIAKAPSCALPCFLTEVASAKCSLVDLGLLGECMCTNNTIISNISTCVQKQCIFADQIKARNIQAEYICHNYPKPRRSNDLKITAIVALALTIPVLLMRCYARWSVARRLFWDDYTAIIATALFIALAGIEIRSAELGFGMHYWDVDPENTTTLLQMFWVVQIHYILIQVFAKVSIALLFGRIFSTVRWFQLTVNGFVIFMFLHGAIFALSCLFQCLPLAAIWDRNLEGRCLNLTGLGWAGGAFSIAEDVFLLVLPIPELWKLQMNRRKKFGLLLLFSLGSFATVTSIVRMKYLVQFASSYDTTWDNMDIVVWSVIEEFIAIICACLPACRPLFTRVIPGFWSSGEDSEPKSTSSFVHSIKSSLQSPALCGGVCGRERLDDIEDDPRGTVPRIAHRNSGTQDSKLPYMFAETKPLPPIKETETRIVIPRRPEPKGGESSPSSVASVSRLSSDDGSSELRSPREVFELRGLKTKTSQERILRRSVAGSEP